MDSQVEQIDCNAAADLIETYWSGSDAAMMKLARSYRAGHTQGVFPRAFAAHRIAALSASGGDAAELAAADAWVDLGTHRKSWREAIVLARDFACEGSEQPDAERLYWAHELRAFDRTFAALPLAKQEQS